MTKNELFEYIKDLRKDTLSINQLREDLNIKNIENILMQLEKEEYIAISFSDDKIKLLDKK
jgi:hypothetical protein